MFTPDETVEAVRKLDEKTEKLQELLKSTKEGPKPAAA